MYQLNCEPVLQEQASVASEKASTTDLWHQRLGHLSESLLKEMVSSELVTGVKIPKRAELSFCEGCVEGKMQRNLSSQWERFALKESCSVCIATCVGQCPLSQLEEENISSPSLMTLDAARFTSCDTSQRC